MMRRGERKGRIRDISYLMKPRVIFSAFKYLMKTEPGSIPFLRTVKSQQPKIEKGKYIADLHAHPYISRDTPSEDLSHTMDVMVKNNVRMLAVTTHGKGSPREMDFWDVKEFMIRNDIEFEDKGNMLTVEHKGKKLQFISSYEMYVEVPGLNGRLDVLVLLPEKEFREQAEQGMQFSDYVKLSRDNNGIVIAAHPYTIWDAHGPANFFTFRIANEGERKLIQDKVFTHVDSADRVSSNCAWMIHSDELLFDDYGVTLTNSDVHAKTKYNRLEIGRAGNVLAEGIDLREAIITRKHENYMNYTPSLQFLISIAFDKPPKGFP